MHKILSYIAVALATLSLFFSTLALTREFDAGCKPGTKRFVADSNYPDDWYWDVCRSRTITWWDFEEWAHGSRRRELVKGDTAP